MHANSHLLRLQNVSKQFSAGAAEILALCDVSLSIGRGQSCAILGPSGSGKTTLIGLCAGLDSPTSGEVWLEDIPLHRLSEAERAAVRLRDVGFVFQSFHLIPTLSALENVLVPLELQGNREAYGQACDLLSRVGLEDRMNHSPGQLSGGEQQRVALARAFVTKPKILFADEPTGNLDLETASFIQRMMFDLNTTLNTTLVIVTHDEALAAKTERIIRLRGGRILSDSDSGPRTKDAPKY